MEVVVATYGEKSSNNACSCSMEETPTFITKESVPVTRWHSNTASSLSAMAMARFSTSPCTVMRMKAVIDMPSFA